MVPVSAETMRELDKMAAMHGLSTLSLMENAGGVVAEKATEVINTTENIRIAIFCGKGNNGGDGFVAARKLKTSGFDVNVYLLGRRGEVKNEALTNLLLFIKSGGIVKEIDSEADIEKLKKDLNHSLIIDAVLGTGFSGSVSGLTQKLIALLNSSNIPILAVDVPSGLNATTGEINPIAIKAKWTISFALPKKGLYEKGGPEHVGSLQVTNIGFPERLLKKAIEHEKKICTTS